MKDEKTYIDFGETENNKIKISLPVVEDMKEFNISKDYILDIIKKMDKNLEKEKVSEELAISYEDKDCIIILSIKKDFLGLDYIIPREKVNE